MPDSHAIDVMWLRKTFDDDAVLTELYTMYVGDAAKRLTELRAGIAAKDPAQCSRIAHTMKGASGNVGADRMRELAAGLEKHDWAADPAGAAILAESLDAEFGRVRDFVEKFVSSCPAAR